MTPYRSRKFLNKKEGIDAIETKVSCTGNFLEATVTIADCYRRVELSFSSHSKAARKEMQGKLNLLINELVLFENALETANLAHPSAG